MTRTIIEGGYVATVDPVGTEHATGFVLIDDGVISQVGAGRAPDDLRAGAEIVDATGCLVTPGLINTHHHLYQWLTRTWRTARCSCRGRMPQARPGRGLRRLRARRWSRRGLSDRSA